MVLVLKGASSSELDPKKPTDIANLSYRIAICEAMLNVFFFSSFNCCARFEPWVCWHFLSLINLNQWTVSKEFDPELGVASHLVIGQWPFLLSPPFSRISWLVVAGTMEFWMTFHSVGNVSSSPLTFTPSFFWGVGSTTNQISHSMSTPDW